MIRRASIFLAALATCGLAYGANGYETRTGDSNTAGAGGMPTEGGARVSNGGATLPPPGSGTSARRLFAVLAGGHEVGADGRANAGDPDGQGTAAVQIEAAAGRLCFALLVDGIETPTAAHIHQAAAGRNGSIVVNLTAPASGDPGNVSGCVSNLDAALLTAIQAQPETYYVNVHTALFPDGAVRGQLY